MFNEKNIIAFTYIISIICFQHKFYFAKFGFFFLLEASVDVNISTVSEEINNIIAACLSHLLQENPQVLRLSWKNSCLNQLKTTLIVIFSFDVTEKNTHPTIPHVALDLVLTPASCLCTVFPHLSAVLVAFLKLTSMLLNV